MTDDPLLLSVELMSTTGLVSKPGWVGNGVPELGDVADGKLCKWRLSPASLDEGLGSGNRAFTRVTMSDGHRTRKARASNVSWGDGTDLAGGKRDN